jgi:hypothetical protein
MTGPDDAFLAPDDALRDTEEDTGPSTADDERAAGTAVPLGDGTGDAGGADGPVDGGPAAG